MLEVCVFFEDILYLYLHLTRVLKHDKSFFDRCKDMVNEEEIQNEFFSTKQHKLVTLKYICPMANLNFISSTTEITLLIRSAN